MIKKTSSRVSRAENMSFSERLSRMNWPLFAMIAVILSLSLIILYSAGYKPCPDQSECLYTFGSWDPWAKSQLFKILFALVVFFATALGNIKTWIKSAYGIYAVIFILVILVSFIGHTGMGAQRWLNLGFFAIQPSEFIKIAVILALARYFSWMTAHEMTQPKKMIVPILIVLMPFVLVLKQPDLGTAITLMMVGGGMFFIAGFPRKWIMIAIASVLVIAPIAWSYGLHDYQRERVMTFIDPSRDIRGGGYQINQAKIALGSGGWKGKGYLNGSQSHLNFLPEKQTDFIFTMLGEELGFIGGFFLLMIYTAIISVIFWIAKTTRNRFGQLLTFGVGINFFTYYFINTAMVMGLLPTVGVPLPLMSFGGSSLLALMFGLGLVENTYIYRDVQLSATGH